MTEKELIAWLRAEITRSANDVRMADSQEWIDFHEGEYEAYNAVMSMIGDVK